MGRGLDGGRGLEPPGRCGLVAINEPQGACLDPRGFLEGKWIHEVFGNIPIPMWLLGALGGNRKEDTALKGQIQEMEAQG